MIKMSDASSYMNAVNLPPGSWLPPSIPHSMIRQNSTFKCGIVLPLRDTDSASGSATEDEGHWAMKGRWCFPLWYRSGHWYSVLLLRQVCTNCIGITRELVKIQILTYKDPASLLLISNLHSTSSPGYMYVKWKLRSFGHPWGTWYRSA